MTAQHSVTTISDAFEDLSHALRVLLEAHLRANTGLLQIDRAEAVGNIEAGLSGVLNAFHSLYDATSKHSEISIDWYASPELSTILILRNARHHNHARKVRTLYTYYVQEAEKVGRMETYVLIDFPAGEEGADAFDLYISWQDLKVLLELPYSITRIKSPDAVRKYLGSDSFASYAGHFDQSESRVFFNVVPLICNAAATIVPVIAPYVQARSTESETYLFLFRDMPQSDTSAPQINCGPVAYMP